METYIHFHKWKSRPLRYIKLISESFKINSKGAGETTLAALSEDPSSVSSSITREHPNVYIAAVPGYPILSSGLQYVSALAQYNVHVCA